MERLRLQPDEEEQFDEEGAARIAASLLRTSLLTDKRARGADGAQLQPPLALVDTPRNGKPPAPVYQTALFNMTKAVVSVKMIDTLLAELFRYQARRTAFCTAWEELILPEALEMIKLRYGLNRGKREASRDIGYEAQVMLVTSLKLAS